MRRVLGYVLTVILVAVIVVASYCIYVGSSFSRLDDGTSIIVQDNFKGEAKSGTTYSAVTLNLGYAVNDKDFSSWKEGGSRTAAEHKETVTENLYDLTDAVKKLGAQLVLFQEVDRDSDRSFGTDMPGKIAEEFLGMASIYMSNYHTAYLLYPFSDPLKRVNSGMMALSSFGINAAVRRSLPLTEGFGRYYSPDYGYSVFRVDVGRNRELYVYNVQLADVGKNPKLARSQLRLILEDMSLRASKGCYVICGGDFGSSLTGEDGAAAFPADMLPDGFSVCKNPSCAPTKRSTAAPYVEGSTPTLTADGFIISSNVECVKLDVADLGFATSDHNPVKLDFKLK